jgi:CheY-like chemotaxis protein
MSSDVTLGRWATNGAQRPLHDHPPVSGPGEPVAPAVIAEAAGLRKKSVLLVDANWQSRESRAKVMRTLGVEVDCAANADAARVRLAADKYDLILVDPGRTRETAELLVREIRTNNSRQRVGFLIGSPLYVAQSLSASPARPRRAPEPPPVASAPKPSAPATSSIDFGQRIRDAEANAKT